MTGVIAVDPIQLTVPSRCRATGPRTLLRGFHVATRKRQSSMESWKSSPESRVSTATLSNGRFFPGSIVACLVCQPALQRPTVLPLTLPSTEAYLPRPAANRPARADGSIPPGTNRLDWSGTRGRDD